MSWKVFDDMTKNRIANPQNSPKNKLKTKYQPKSRCPSLCSQGSKLFSSKSCISLLSIPDIPKTRTKEITMSEFEDFKRKVEKSLKELKSFCLSIRNMVLQLQKFYRNSHKHVQKQFESVFSQSKKLFQCYFKELDGKLKQKQERLRSPNWKIGESKSVCGKEKEAESQTKLTDVGDKQSEVNFKKRILRSSKSEYDLRSYRQIMPKHIKKMKRKDSHI